MLGVWRCAFVLEDCRKLCLVADNTDNEHTTHCNKRNTYIKHTRILFVHFAKAFDPIDHNILLNKSVSSDVLKHIAVWMSVLSSTPKKVTDKLQHVQSAAARLVTGTWKYERGLSRLMHNDLHWLLIPQ